MDLNRKPAIYTRVGVPEFWRFDPSGGRYYGFALNGLKLLQGEYQPVELTTEPDGVLKGYSEVLQLSLAWDEGWPRFYDPATGAYLEEWRDDRRALQAEREALQTGRDALQAELEWREPQTRKGYANWKRSCAACAQTHRRPHRSVSTGAAAEVSGHGGWSRTNPLNSRSARPPPAFRSATAWK